MEMGNKLTMSELPSRYYVVDIYDENDIGISSKLVWTDKEAENLALSVVGTRTHATNPQIGAINAVVRVTVVDNGIETPHKEYQA